MKTEDEKKKPETQTDTTFIIIIIIIIEWRGEMERKLYCSESSTAVPARPSGKDWLGRIESVGKWRR